MKISTNTINTINALLTDKDVVKVANENHVSSRQNFVESAIADIRVEKENNPKTSNKDIAIEYNLVLDANIPENRLKAERAMIDYVALNSNISNTIEYKIAVKLKRLKASNSRLNNCKNNDDYAELVTALESERDIKLLADNSALVAYLKGKDVVELEDFASVAKLLAKALKDAEK